MLMDALLLFSDAQAVTAAAASTNSIDIGQAVRDIGVGENLYIVVVCTVAMTDAGSNSTLDVALEGDSTTTITPDYTRTLFSFSAVSAAGTTKISRLQPGDLALRYAQLKYTPQTGDLTTGSFTAAIVHEVDKWAAMPDSITIS